MRVLKRQYSKRRKKRQFEETDFLTFWSDLFNFANLGPGAYFEDTTYTGGANLNILGTLALTGTFGGAMMAGMPQPNFQVSLNDIMVAKRSGHSTREAVLNIDHMYLSHYFFPKCHSDLVVCRQKLGINLPNIFFQE